MANYPTNNNPAKESVFANVAPGAGTTTFDETQRAGQAECDAAQAGTVDRCAARVVAL